MILNLSKGGTPAGKKANVDYWVPLWTKLEAFRNMYIYKYIYGTKGQVAEASDDQTIKQKKEKILWQSKAVFVLHHWQATDILPMVGESWSKRQHWGID